MEGDVAMGYVDFYPRLVSWMEDARISPEQIILCEHYVHTGDSRYFLSKQVDEKGSAVNTAQPNLSK